MARVYRIWADRFPHEGHAGLRDMQDELLRAAMAKAEDPACAPEHLTDEECAALGVHVATRLSEAGLDDYEYAQCVRIQRLIAQRAQQGGVSINTLDPEAARRRTNWMLRNAIEKTRQGRPQELSEQEVTLVENTLRGLTALYEPSDNHRRLQEILEQALDTYYTFYAESVTPAQTAVPLRPVAPSVVAAAPAANSPVSTAIPAETFLQGGQRRKMEYLGAIPLNQNLYYYEYEGDLHLSGDIGKEYYVEVRGALRVDGCIYGVVLADRGVQVQGDINGGSVLTFDGNLSATRVQAGSRLVAPRGSIHCNSIERATLLFCAGSLQVAGDLNESRTLCSSLNVGGKLARGLVSLLDGAQVNTIINDGGKGAQVDFRAVHSSIDFGGDIESQDAHTIKEYVRARFDVELTSATQRIFEAEYASLLKAMLHLFQGGAPVESGIATLREMELAWALLGVAEVAASELMLAVRRAIELPGVPDLTVLSPALDVCQRGIRFLKAESEGLPQDLVPQRRQKLASAVSQLSNYAKQVRDAGAGGGDLAATYFPLRDRCAEWHAEREELAQAFPAARAAMVEALGPAIAGESKIDVLLQLVRKAQEGSQMRSRLLPALKKLLEHYGQSASRWGAGLPEARQRLAQAEGILRDSGTVQFAGTAAQALHIGPGGVAGGTVLRTASFADPASPVQRGAVHVVSADSGAPCDFAVVAGGIVTR